MDEKISVYLAGPLFSRSEIDGAKDLKREIEAALGEKVEVVWPFEIASGTTEEIFEANHAALRRSPLMVAILDGARPKAGWFLASLDAEFVRERLVAASAD